MINQTSDITLCLTIGLRPDLLRSSLASLLAHVHFEKVIAINDFRDEATNSVFRELCPQGQLVSLDRQLGHHAAVDHAYSLIETPYVFHSEDDWHFDSSIDLISAMDLLRENPELSQVCFRKIEDFAFSTEETARIVHFQRSGLNCVRLDGLHDQWHGYTFNPHLAAIETWRSVGGFSKFKKERHISRSLRRDGKYSAYMENGVCHHIGALLSVSGNDIKDQKLRQWKESIKELFRSIKKSNS
ncbi:hypothetical protein [Limnohabitans sp.]|uniref:hypothetical protein n=1 Tax=Limnohabitans sp. TaxID=1907725 RepID=UPI0033427AE5